MEPNEVDAGDVTSEEDAMMAGFKGEELAPPPVVEEPVVGEEEAVVVEEPEPPKFLTKAELEEALAEINRKQDKAFGKIGELQQRVDTVRAQAGRFSAAEKEKLAEVFPELAQTLDFLFSGETVEAPDVESIVEAKLALREEARLKSEQARATKRLKAKHADWETIRDGSEFDAFLKTKPPEEQAEFWETWDADYVSETISEFKKQQVKEPEKKQKSDKLANAVTPKGVQTPGVAHSTDEEEEAMMASFKKR